MRIRTNGEGYEWFAEDASDTPAYHHRLIAIAEHGFRAVQGMDVHHDIPVQWLNYAGNLTVEDPTEHRKRTLNNVGRAAAD